MNITEDPVDVRALLVDLSMKFGGASTRAADIVRKSDASGWGLAVLRDSEALEHAQTLGLKTYVVGSHRADPGIVLRLSRVIRKDDFGLIDAQNPQSKLWGSLAARRTGRAFVSTLNSWPMSEYGASLRGYVYTFLERSVRHWTQMHIAVSTEIQNHLVNDGVPDNHVVCIPAAVEIDPEGIQIDTAEFKVSLGIHPDAAICVAVGRLVEAKGYPILLSAMIHLMDRYPTLHCLIIGDGPLKNRLQTEIESSGLKRKVHILGSLPRAATLRVLSICDVFIMSSISEGTPVALLEAASLARPIVASKVGGIPSMLSDSDHALLIPPGDIDALIAATEELLDHPQTATAMAERAQQHIQLHYGLDKQIELTKRAYRQALINLRQQSEKGR